MGNEAQNQPARVADRPKQNDRQNSIHERPRRKKDERLPASREKAYGWGKRKLLDKKEDDRKIPPAGEGAGQADTVSIGSIDSLNNPLSKNLRATLSASHHTGANWRFCILPFDFPTA